METVQAITVELAEQFSDLKVTEFRGQTRVALPREKRFDVARSLRDGHGFDMLVDITCIDYLNYRDARDRFGLVYLFAGTVDGRRLTFEYRAGERLMSSGSFDLDDSV